MWCNRIQFWPKVFVDFLFKQTSFSTKHLLNFASPLRHLVSEIDIIAKHTVLI